MFHFTTFLKFPIWGLLERIVWLTLSKLHLATLTILSHDKGKMNSLSLFFLSVGGKIDNPQLTFDATYLVCNKVIT